MSTAPNTTPMPLETERSVAPLLAALDLTPDGDDAFLGTHQVIPGGRAYGGEVVAQAERAMALTTGDDRRIISLHGYFLRAGDVNDKTRWEVERVRDGRGFSHRAVRGVQNGKEIFRAMAQFGVPSPGIEHDLTIPDDAGDPESLPSTADALSGVDTRDAEYWRRHVEYCWMNPVKHGLVDAVRDWPLSSFHRDVRRGLVSEDWGGTAAEGQCGE